MRPLYAKIEDDIEIYDRKSSHFSPQVHGFLECILVTEGTLEIGLEQELYHMETGDLALLFPGLVHHAQVFGGGVNRSIHLLAAPACCGGFRQQMMRTKPVPPVLPAASLHPDVPYALQRILEEKRGGRDRLVARAFTEVLLARCMPLLALTERGNAEDEDLVYRVVAYIGEHATEPVTLTSMAGALHASPYAISRIFSGVFHTNFNEYVNASRLEYALNLLRYTDQNITEVWMNAGFESQRTFNRFFKDKLHMTPREFRKQGT